MAANNKTWPEWLRTVQPGDFLYPENEYKLRVIPEGLMKHLMHRAAELLQARVNCSALERQHWEQLAAGVPPYGLMIERRTKKGIVHVKSIKGDQSEDEERICAADNVPKL